MQVLGQLSDLGGGGILLLILIIGFPLLIIALFGWVFVVSVNNRRAAIKTVKSNRPRGDNELNAVSGDSPQCPPNDPPAGPSADASADR